jgi:GNAT superfamily N-acetyltransferase
MFTSSTTPNIHTRLMRDDGDFWRMRNLLVETAPLMPVGFNWDVRRLDGQRFYNADLAANRLLNRQVCLWETMDGHLAGYVLPEGGDDAHVQVHPDFRYLEKEMIHWAENALAGPTQDGQARQLYIEVNEYDAWRQRILVERGFDRLASGGMTRHMRLGQQPLSTAAIASGYTMRTTRVDDMADCQGIADLLNAAFGRTFHNAAEFHNFATSAPSFRPELDLVAVAPDGTFAAYVGVPYDEPNRLGIFEPVCTHPDPQRKGLARALMHEGLLRLRALGATDAMVGTGGMIPANSLYTAMGFTEAYKSYTWRKDFAPAKP